MIKLYWSKVLKGLRYGNFKRYMNCLKLLLQPYLSEREYIPYPEQWLRKLTPRTTRKKYRQNVEQLIGNVDKQLGLQEQDQNISCFGGQGHISRTLPGACCQRVKDSW